MTEMNVSMSLTLADAASGPLRAFAGLLEQLGKVAASTVTRLDGVAASITGVIQAAAGSAQINAFTSSLSAAGAVLGAVETQGAATAASLKAVGTEALAAGAGVKSGAAAMEGGLIAANTQASSLMTTLKGLGELYAAFEIKKGLTAAVGDAIEYQNTQTRLANMNVGAGGEAALTAAAAATSRAVPQVSQNQALEMGIDLRNATGSVEHALEMLTPFAIAAYDMKMATPNGKTFDDRDMLLIAKSLEQRNATQDPVRMQAELDMLTKVYAATQGRVDAQQILGNLQYSRGGLGQSLDLSFIPMMAAMIEQIKSGGGNGGQVGTGLTAMQRYVLGNVKNGTSAKEADALGLIDDSKVVWNKNGNINLKKSDLTMAGSEEFQRNPYAWVQDYLKPAMIRAGIDLTNDAAVNKTLTALFPAGTANSVATTMVNRGSLLEKDAANINQTADGAGQYQNNVKTAQANIDAFKAQLTNLGIVLGTTLLPVVTRVAKALTTAFEWLADFFTEHPIVAQITAWAAAFTAVGLAVAGFAALFGALGLDALFAGIATAAAGMGTAVLAAFAPFLPVVLPIVAGIAVLVAAWQLGVGDIQVAGHSLGDWMEAILGKLGGLLSSLGSTIAEWAGGVKTSVTDAFDKLGNAWNNLSDVFTLAVGGLKVGSKSVSEWFDTFADDIKSKASSLADYVGGKISGMLSGVERAVFGGRKELPKGVMPGTAGAGRGSYIGYDPNGSNFDFGVGGNDWNDKKKGGPKPPGSATDKYNEGADVAANQFKREEDDLRANLKAADDLYRLGLSSVEEYYGTKQAVLEVAIDAEIAALMKEKAAFDARGNKAGSNRAQTQIDAAQNRLQTGTADNEAAKARELLTLDQKLAEFRRAEFQSAGERHQAELLRIQQTLDAEGKVLIQNGLVTQSEIDAAKARATAASEYSFAQEKIGALQDAEKQKEEDIQAAVANGTITTTAGDDQIYALRQKLSAQLDDLLAQTKELADASGDPKLVRQNADQTAANNRMGTALPADAVTMNRAVQTSFENLFSNIIGGSMSATQAFRKFGSSIIETFQNLISKRLGDQLYASLFSSSAGGGGGGSLGDFFGSLFGGSSGSTSAGSAAVDNGSVNLFADAALTSFDVGTDYVPHDMIAMIHEGEKITPAAYNKPGKDGAGMTVHNHFTVTGPVDHRSQQQIAAAAGMGVNRALARAR
jgi:hypothetical protein